MPLQRHDLLPEVRLKGTDGKKHDLQAEHRGRNLVVYLFANDRDDGLASADGFDRYRQAFDRLDADVVGISPGWLHQEKALAREGDIHHLLLADRRHLVAERLGAWDAAEHRVVPTAVLVDRDGRVERIYRGLDPERTAATAERILRHLDAVDREERWDGHGTPPQAETATDPAPEAATSPT